MLCSLRLKSAILLAVCFRLTAQAAEPKTGTLTLTESGEKYLGTKSESNGRQSASAVIFRTDQVYVIVGDGMEYVVTEAGHSPAHVIVNAPIRYSIVDDKFVFYDQEGRPHPARIARQTLIDLGRITPVEPTIWKDVASGYRLHIRHSENSIYAETLLTKKQSKTFPKIAFEAKSEDGRFFKGHTFTTLEKCVSKSDVEMTFSGSRIEGERLVQAVGAKFDKKACQYSKNTTVRFVWVPE
jgi:hypothetical protein